jgi:hypothetical protein
MQARENFPSFLFSPSSNAHYNYCFSNVKAIWESRRGNLLFFHWKILHNFSTLICVKTCRQFETFCDGRKENFRYFHLSWVKKLYIIKKCNILWPVNNWVIENYLWKCSNVRANWVNCSLKAKWTKKWND